MDQERLGQTNDILRRVALALERLAPNQQTTQSAIDALLRIGITDSGRKSEEESSKSGGSRGKSAGRGRDDSGDEDSSPGKGPPRVPDRTAEGMVKGLGPSVSRLFGAGESLMPGLGLGEIGGTISKMVNLLNAFDGAKDALGRMGLLGDESQKLDPPDLPKSHRPIPLVPPPIDQGPIPVLPPELPGPLPAEEEKIPLVPPRGYNLAVEPPPTPMPTVAADETQSKTPTSSRRDFLGSMDQLLEILGAAEETQSKTPTSSRRDVHDSMGKLLQILGAAAEPMNSPDLLGPLRPVGTVGADLTAPSEGEDKTPTLKPDESGLDPVPSDTLGSQKDDEAFGAAAIGQGGDNKLLHEIKGMREDIVKANKPQPQAGAAEPNKHIGASEVAKAMTTLHASTPSKTPFDSIANDLQGAQDKLGEILLKML